MLSFQYSEDEQWIIWNAAQVRRFCCAVLNSTREDTITKEMRQIPTAANEQSGKE